MKIKVLKTLEHDGEVYHVGDDSEVVFDNGVKAGGKIIEFGTYGFSEEGLTDVIQFGKYYVPLCQIVEVKKKNRSIDKLENEIMSFAVAILAEVVECAKKR